MYTKLYIYICTYLPVQPRLSKGKHPGPPPKDCFLHSKEFDASDYSTSIPRYIILLTKPYLTCFAQAHLPAVSPTCTARGSRYTLASTPFYTNLQCPQPKLPRTPTYLTLKSDDHLSNSGYFRCTHVRNEHCLLSDTQNEPPPRPLIGARSCCHRVLLELS